MEPIERSVELANMNPELKALIKETNNEIADWYGVDLTDKQIVTIYNNNPSLYTEALDSKFDTLARETFADILCNMILGISWPTGGEIARYEGGEDKFFADLKSKGKSQGYVFVED